MLGLFRHAGKYNIDYCGQKQWYAGAKDSYKAGQRVHLEYGPMATDTEYCFFADGNPVAGGYNERNCRRVIEFVMPEHDVAVECRCRSSFECKEN